MNPRKQLFLQILLKNSEKMGTPQQIVNDSDKKLWMGDIRQLGEELQNEGHITSWDSGQFTYYKLTVLGETQAAVNGDVTVGKIWGIFNPSKWPVPSDLKFRYVPPEFQS